MTSLDFSVRENREINFNLFIMANVSKELKRKSQQIYNDLLGLQKKVEENDLGTVDWYIEFINKLNVYVNGE